MLEEFNLWKSMLMIIADTTSVNTGRKNGVVVQLQKMLEKNGSPKPMFIICQHHVLDRILRVVIDDELQGSTKSPNIEYFFIKDMTSEYDKLKAAFCNGKAEIEETAGWRDDMKFLFHLTRVFHHFTEKIELPFVRFQNIPNISNTHWNSRAILALLAFMLMPETRSRLDKVCSFLSYTWTDLWFSNQFFHAEDYDEVSTALNEYPQALKGLKTHWKRE